MASVTYDHVTKRYGEVLALSDLDISIQDKEFFVMVGPTGCGKSTALRCLAGLEKVSEGQILIGDQIVNDLPPQDRDIAMVFESYALYSHMSIFNNMAFGLQMRKTPKDVIKKRVEAAGETLGIGKLLERKPRQLSAGHRQAAAVGRTIARVPRVFLFDDPISNLDAKQRIEIRTNIIRLHQELDTTFIYVTHDQTEAMTLAARIAVLNFGRLQQIDTPQKLYDTPDNLFVAGFIGSPAMNFFPAKIHQREGKLVVDADSFTLDIPKNRRSVYAGHIEVPVIFGIRPEDIYMPEFTPPGINAQPVNTQVDISEFIGNEIILHLKSGEHDVVARVDPRTRATIGESLQVAFNMDHMHLFDRESKLAIR